MNLREHEPLRWHTTLRTGGPARFFIAAESAAEIHEAVAFARQRRLPLLVLGGGSNLLVSEAGFPGVVIHIATQGIETHADGESTEIIAEAGESWDGLVGAAVARGLCGLENMSLIPGMVGAAVAGNIGAYGAEVKDVLRWAEALDIRSGARRRFPAGDCALRYRHSFFKTAEGRHFIITRAAFGLRRPARLNTAYKDVREYFAALGIAEPGLAEMRNAVMAIRRRKLPDLDRIGTAGSFFKNPLLTPAVYETLAGRYPGLPGHGEEHGLIKVPLGWILDRICGLKGARRGRVGLHSEQALVLVNEGGTAAEIEAFAQEIAAEVKTRTGLEIEWEVEKIAP